MFFTKFRIVIDNIIYNKNLPFCARMSIGSLPRDLSLKILFPKNFIRDKTLAVVQNEVMQIF